MKTELTTVNSYLRELDIRVEWHEMKSEFDALINKYHSTYQRKGFRKGKFPKALFKKEMGPSIEVEFSDKAVNKYFSDALEKHQINPINQAKIDHFHFHENSDLHFKAVFEVIPDFELPNYKSGIKISVNKIEKTEKDILKTLENIRKQYAENTTVDRPAKETDLLLTDIQELDSEGNPIPGNNHENQLISIDRGIFSEDDHKLFLGKSAGDTVSLSGTSSETPVNFRVTIKEVKEQILPELTDEFAAKVRPEAKTVDDLMKSIENELQQELDRRFEHESRDRIADYFVKHTKLEVPSSMKEKYLDSIVEDVKKKNPNEKLDEKKVRESYAEMAENVIRWQLVMDKLIHEENLKVEKEDLDKKFEDLASQYGTTAEKVKAMYSKSDRISNLTDEIINDKLFGNLKSFTKIKEVVVTTDKAEKSKKK